MIRKKITQQYGDYTCWNSKGEIISKFSPTNWECETLEEMKLLNNNAFCISHFGKINLGDYLELCNTTDKIKVYKYTSKGWVSL